MLGDFFLFASLVFFPVYGFVYAAPRFRIVAAFSNPRRFRSEVRSQIPCWRRAKDPRERRISEKAPKIRESAEDPGQHRKSERAPKFRVESVPMSQVGGEVPSQRKSLQRMAATTTCKEGCHWPELEVSQLMSKEYCNTAILMSFDNLDRVT